MLGVLALIVTSTLCSFAAATVKSRRTTSHRREKAREKAREKEKEMPAQAAWRDAPGATNPRNASHASPIRATTCALKHTAKMVSTTTSRKVA